ncbi:programmed cell death protein 5 isoform X1 [Tympanuchus pallidicinctus]|uniref:programmed cell death protein 5 isoform X1 n=1 Tax=Tympanuchus pallidicinctus TaxID=109042 RepID=UPI002286E31B|nr:programmed cell death protein 5 isoform X1 [Tympanuchus pallidicinctus]
MADEELAALRQQRLAELQAKHGDTSADPSQQEAKQREAEIRNTILAQVLDQAARARLSNLALVKPDKAKAVENYLIQMARFGQLPGKVSEQGLIEILEKVSQQTEKKTTVKVSLFQSTDSMGSQENYLKHGLHSSICFYSSHKLHGCLMFTVVDLSSCLSSVVCLSRSVNKSLLLFIR